VLRACLDLFDRDELVALGFTRPVTNEIGWELPRP
jgi:hypothetical protein